MNRNSKLVKVIQDFYQKLGKYSPSAIKEQSLWLLRTFLITRRQSDWVNSGFVLPTVAMVAIVVVLLTTAILFRSFERSKNASNVRVNEAVLNAATPAIDRARAKINKLFEDPQLPRATPTDKALYNAFAGNENNSFQNINAYTFGDETPLKLDYTDSTSTTTELRTAWKYPVDTDNNGKFDSYTLYGIYFRNPEVSEGKFKRARNPLEARTPPMIGGNVSGNCEDIIGTSATLVGNTGWFNIGGKLKKSFFVYTTNVPITQTENLPNGYETHKGNKGFSALEYQQDRVQLPSVNNAVVYEDDIALGPGPAFNLNGRIITNSNFITGGGTGVNLYQVSSINSCFYEADNAKIIVGGNLGAGGFADADDYGTTKVHLFQGKSKAPNPNSEPAVGDHKSIVKQGGVGGPSDIAFNSLAYQTRITRLVEAQMANGANTDPQEVKDRIDKEKEKLGIALTAEEEETLRQQQLDRYFKRRTRRVPYAEVGFNQDALGAFVTGGDSPLQGEGDSLRPVDAWIYPTNPDDGKTTNTNLTLNISGETAKPGATEPKKLQQQLNGIEQYLGDRALLGNNLPELWWDKQKGKFVGPNQQDTQELKDIKWDNGDGTRTRRTRIEQLADLGAINRDKDWELAAAKKADVDNNDYTFGGLRVITGAGIYLPPKYTTAGTTSDTDFSTASDNPDKLKIWSDMMPVASDKATVADDTSEPYSYITLSPDIPIPIKDYIPYLRMRATAVYHYKSANYDEKNPKPIACVSSYYDPTESKTARNKAGLPDVSPPLYSPKDNSNAGNSNNGVVYGPPTKSLTDYQAVLDYQAKLTYPNGRLVNEPLQKALAKDAANRTLSEQSAIDAALCALEILEGSITPTDDVIPHGAIMETAFLDARQIKAIHAESGANVPSTAEYNLPKEDRQPLEIRTTVLDVDLLRQKTIGDASPAQEYLVPNSGIIYATRDDALLDLSAAKPTTGSEASKEETQRLESSVDFKLDPTRRPNAIMLINGSKVWRELNYREAEKGFILASNLPVYIKGDFNLHQNSAGKVEEFTEQLDEDSWSNFYSRPANTLNPDFACRKGDPRLPKCETGDEWRPASVLADAITLLSNNFRLGYRDEGDFDLNDNLGQMSPTDLANKGLSRNSYAINTVWYDTSDSNLYPKDFDTVTSLIQGSSYLNNFVTPIQRRGRFNEYLMEFCPKLPVTECQWDDWYVKYDPLNPANNQHSWEIATNDTIDVSTLDSGTTAVSAASAYQRYPRRVAFRRNADGTLVLDGSNRPTILGIAASGNIQQYPIQGGQTRLAINNNALWFQTSDNNNSIDSTNNASLVLDNQSSLSSTNKESQPRLLPVLQHERLFGTPDAQVTGNDNKLGPPNNRTAPWLQAATETTFNLAAAAGDTPARPVETNGGLHNFVRFIENWNPTGGEANAIKARISGSFIQIKRSAYATGPFLAMTLSDGTYPIGGNNNRAPFYIAPKRQWGYDVGLLSQAPDLFAQKLVRTPDDLPDEYFREVSRDDIWVKTLLCAKKPDDTAAVDADQRPTNCE